jgi:hypothetical protein
MPSVAFNTSTGLQYTDYNPSLTPPQQIYANVPSGNNGKLMVAVIQWTRLASIVPAAITMPGDWDEAIASNVENFSFAIYSKFGDGSTAPFPISFSTIAYVTLDILLFDNAKASAPIGASNVGFNTETYIHVAPSVTSTINGSMVLHAYGVARGGMDFVLSSALLELADYPAYDYSGFAAGCRVLSTAGPSGAANASSLVAGFGAPNYSGYSVNFSLIIQKSEAPSAPTFIKPVAGEIITIGRNYPGLWGPSVDPNIATNLLDYELRFSKDGINWTTIVAHTDPGAITYDWDTTGLTAGTYQLSLRAWNGTEYGPYIYQNVVLVNDAVPLAPTNLQPNSSQVKNRQLVIRLSYQFNDPGDLQKAQTIEYSYDNFATIAGTIVATTVDEFSDIAAATFTAGLVYWRVKTKDEVGNTYGPFSTIAVFQALDPPAAPVITTPLAISPPISANPNLGWTSVGQDQYKIRLIDETLGVVKYAGAFVRSGLKLIPNPSPFKNLHQIGFYVSIMDSNGLESLEDYESFLVTFLQPPKPLIEVFASNVGGFYQIAITNPSTPQPEYNEVWRFKTATETEDDAIVISPPLDPGATFQDSLVESGVEYSYFCRAYLDTGGFDDSTVESATVYLDGLFLVTPTKTSQRGNAESAALVLTYRPVVQDNEGYASNSYARKEFEGRPKPVTVFGQTKGRELSYNLYFKPSQRSLLDALDALFALNKITCAMDREGNKLHSRFTKTTPIETLGNVTMQITFTQTEYNEAIEQ